MFFVNIYVNGILRVPACVIRCDFTNFPKHNRSGILFMVLHVIFEAILQFL
jgi:hypothetical protein